jgi:hypothetical protein
LCACQLELQMPKLAGERLVTHVNNPKVAVRPQGWDEGSEALSC